MKQKKELTWDEIINPQDPKWLNPVCGICLGIAAIGFIVALTFLILALFV